MKKQCMVETKFGFRLGARAINNGKVYEFGSGDIKDMLSRSGVRLYEILPCGQKIRLTKDNYNSVNIPVVNEPAEVKEVAVPEIEIKKQPETFNIPKKVVVDEDTIDITDELKEDDKVEVAAEAEEIPSVEIPEEEDKDEPEVAQPAEEVKEEEVVEAPKPAPAPKKTQPRNNNGGAKKKPSTTNTNKK